MLDGVAAAHAHGVIHRDLKPENVLVVRGSNGHDAIKLLDFGLAKLRTDGGEVTASVTAPARVLGTLAYMAPEQLLGRAVDERTDIFALGVIMFELLYERRPFADDPLLRLVEIRQGLPAESFQHTGIQRVLSRCVASEPDDRYDSVVTLRAELLPLIER
jgi:eukaryotic-like serine/threonine-protein kinase